MLPKYRRMWVVGAAIGIVTGGGLMIVVARNSPEKQEQYLCWDAPTTGPPANYQLTFDGVGEPLVTTGECVRLPALSVGDHTAEVRAVNSDGHAGPAAVLRFSIQRDLRVVTR